MEDEQVNDWSYVVALFAKYFGWDIAYTLNLSPCTIALLQESLGEILRSENGEKDPKKDFERNKIVTEMRIEGLKKEKKDKKEFNISDLLTIAGD